MGVTRLESICKTLIRLGKPATTPAALVEAGTLPRQRTVGATIADLPERAAKEGIGPPALLVVGEVVARRPALRWFEDLPLFGQRIVVTRPIDEAERSAAGLESLGAEVLIAPTVEIRPLESFGELDRAIGRLNEFDWLVFTSANGVQQFLERLDFLGRDSRALGHLKLATIGPATAEALRRYHLKADLVPRSFRSEDLAEALGPHVAGGRVLLARADRGRTVLNEELQRISQVEQVAVYRNTDAAALPPDVVQRIEQGSLDWITLTSSAIAERLHSLLTEAGRELVGRQIRLASLSPVTSETARRLGWSVAAEAKVYTWAGLVDAIVETVGADRASP
jgi:uroporphyrinogen III methyltransferase/synthase